MTFDPVPNAVVDELASFPGWAIPQGWRPLNVASCRSCRAEVMWCDTKSHKRSPINRDGASHFATCPQAESWRRPTGKAAVTGHETPDASVEPVSRLPRQRWVEGEG